MKIKKLNKKGGEKLLSVWWFFVLAVIGGGISLGVMIYYTADVNTNSIEADVLSNRIINCISDNGILKNEIFETGFDIFNFCNLDKKMFERGSFIYFNVSIFDQGDTVLNISAGDYSIEGDCRVSKKVYGKYFPKCSEKIRNLIYKDKILKLAILTGSNQKGGRIPIVK